MNDNSKRPKWVPKEGGDEYTSRVVDGAGVGASSSDGPTKGASGAEPVTRRREITADAHVQGVLSGDRTVLARTITLVESNSTAHRDKAQAVLKQLLPSTGRSIRVGITGAPGVGKSSFVEALGCHLVDNGHKVAVLAIDPSSSITRGSILGDKTRMERLSNEPNCFIRPSPSGGTLGGVARKSRETMLVCEAAGFDVVLIETIGVGQNEFMVRSMVDFFLLLVLAGAGDELQGIKRGVMELADAILVNKADGDNKARAEVARAEYARAIHYLSPATRGWQTESHTCSALTGEGVADIWRVVEAFRGQVGTSGELERRRKGQGLDWVHMMIEEHLRSGFFGHPSVKRELPRIEAAVSAGEMPATAAVDVLLELFETEDS